MTSGKTPIEIYRAPVSYRTFPRAPQGVVSEGLLGQLSRFAPFQAHDQTQCSRHISGGQRVDFGAAL